MGPIKEFFGDRFEYVQQGQALWVSNGAGGKLKLMESYWAVRHDGDVSTISPESFENMFMAYTPKAQSKIKAETERAAKEKADRKAKTVKKAKPTKPAAKTKSKTAKKKNPADPTPDTRPMATKTVSVDQIALAMMFPAPPTTAEIAKLKTAVAKAIRELERAHK
jgi:hypothetical protein